MFSARSPVLVALQKLGQYHPVKSRVRSLSTSAGLDSLTVSEARLWVCLCTNCNSSCYAFPIDAVTTSELTNALYWLTESFMIRKVQSLACTAAITANNTWGNFSLIASMLRDRVRWISSNGLRWCLVQSLFLPGTKRGTYGLAQLTEIISLKEILVVDRCGERIFKSLQLYTVPPKEGIANESSLISYHPHVSSAVSMGSAKGATKASNIRRNITCNCMYWDSTASRNSQWASTSFLSSAVQCDLFSELLRNWRVAHTSSLKVQTSMQ